MSATIIETMQQALDAARFSLRQRVADYADEVSKHRNANIEDAWAKYVSAEDAVIIAAKKMAFAAGWDASKRDEYAAEDEDIADADDVGFCEWLKAEGK